MNLSWEGLIKTSLKHEKLIYDLLGAPMKLTMTNGEVSCSVSNRAIRDLEQAGMGAFEGNKNSSEFILPEKD